MRPCPPKDTKKSSSYTGSLRLSIQARSRSLLFVASLYLSRPSSSSSASRTSSTSLFRRCWTESAETELRSTVLPTTMTGSHPTNKPMARLWAVALPPISSKASSIDKPRAKTNHKKEMKTGMTPFLRPSRRLSASSLRRATILSRASMEPSSCRLLSNKAMRRSHSASIGGNDILIESARVVSAPAEISGAKREETISSMGKSGLTLVHDTQNVHGVPYVGKFRTLRRKFIIFHSHVDHQGCLAGDFDIP